MKVIFKYFSILLVCLFLTSCAKQQENPLVEYSSLKEINKLAGVNICKPAINGITNEKFYMNENETASYQFEVNNYIYYIRGCRDLYNDMSGIFINSKPAFEGVTDKVAFVEEEGYKVYRFILGNKQYCFGVNDKENLSKDLFSEQFENYKNQMIEENTLSEIKDLVGLYQDSISQRASAEIKLVDDINIVAINIMWSNSASSTEEIKCECKFSLGELMYDEISHTVTEVDENNIETTIELDDIGPGHFLIKGKALYWEGTNNEALAKCVFEKIN